jgi:hypothetical protein
VRSCQRFFSGGYIASVIRRKIIRLHLQIKVALDESASLDQPHYKVRKVLGASSGGDRIRRYHFLLGLGYQLTSELSASRPYLMETNKS